MDVTFCVVRLLYKNMLLLVNSQSRYFTENRKMNTSGGVLTMQGLLKNNSVILKP